jgi:hypothetical protein
MLIFGDRACTRPAEHEAHYNGRHPRRSCQLRPPQPDDTIAGPSQEPIRRRLVLGGLSNEYEQAG